jgi:hypothetical protein
VFIYGYWWGQCVHSRLLVGSVCSSTVIGGSVCSSTVIGGVSVFIHGYWWGQCVHPRLLVGSVCSSTVIGGVSVAHRFRFLCCVFFSLFCVLYTVLLVSLGCSLLTESSVFYELPIPDCLFGFLQHSFINIKCT